VTTVTIDATFESWQEAARTLLRRSTRPRDLIWREKRVPRPPLADLDSGDAGESAMPAGRRSGVRMMVPRRFVAAARWVAVHRDPDRWDVLYRVLWRILHENRKLLDNALDPDVEPFQTMFAQTRRDEHKMRAFVRFRKVDTNDGPHYVAFHRPDHHIVRLAAPFFAGRFASMRWTILTPDECAHWDGERLTFSPGVGPGAAPDDDEIEELWRSYYASVFNPAPAGRGSRRSCSSGRSFA
jgi:probable DNA metabolism protein